MDEWMIWWAKSDSIAVFNFIFFSGVRRKGRERRRGWGVCKTKKKNLTRKLDDWIKVNAVGEKKLRWNFSRYGGGGNWNVIQIVQIQDGKIEPENLEEWRVESKVPLNFFILKLKKKSRLFRWEKRLDFQVSTLTNIRFWFCDYFFSPRENFL